MTRLWVCGALLVCVSFAWADPRLRTVYYSVDTVYRLRGYVGYQIDLQFEADESFIGLAAGDIDALTFTTQGNHLFLKPRATRIATNLTVLTNRRHYQFEYTVSDTLEPAFDDVVYALRFNYPEPLRKPVPEAGAAKVEPPRPGNVDYWFCGDRSLKPLAASDDGVHTRIRFDPRAELPALFVRNEDGSESLLNFHVDNTDLVVHRVAKQLVLRRGHLTGCIVNRGFGQGGAR